MSNEVDNRIVFLVGNGFDISALKYVGSKYTTSYESFYYFLKMSNFNEENLLLEKMERLKDEGAPNWSDFEAALETVYDEGSACIEKLEEDLNEIQIQFSKFLNFVVNDDVLESINKFAGDNQCGSSTYAGFLGDLSCSELDSLIFMKNTGHHQKFKFDIFNFNYTSLLDNFLYLGKEQFDPHPYATVDNNFKFYPNPRGLNLSTPFPNSETRWSCQIDSNLYHPHGYQDIPRSMLFGFDRDYRPKDTVTKFLKPYWGQNNKKYSDIFRAANIFVIYGMSLGVSDRWWWREICKSLHDKSAELIIYRYSEGAKGDEDDVKERFIESANLDGDSRFDDFLFMDTIKERISVIFFDENSENFAFSLNPPKF